MIKLKKKQRNISQYINIHYQNYEEGFKFFDKLKELGYFNTFNITRERQNDEENNIEISEIAFNQYGKTFIFENENGSLIRICSDLSKPNQGFFQSLTHDDSLLNTDNIFNFEFLDTILSLDWANYYYLLQDLNYESPSYDYISKNVSRNTRQSFGFNLYWASVIDYVDLSQTKIPKDVLLKAPAFMVKELKSGSVYVRLTEEEPDPYEFIVEFVDAYMEFYNYCMDYVKSVE